VTAMIEYIGAHPEALYRDYLRYGLFLRLWRGSEAHVHQLYAVVRFSNPQTSRILELSLTKNMQPDPASGIMRNIYAGATCITRQSYRGTMVFPS